jgi:hypothetical protein
MRELNWVARLKHMVLESEGLFIIRGKVSRVGGLILSDKARAK